MKNIIISTAMFCFTLLTCAGYTQNSVFKISFNSDGKTYKGVLLAYDDNDWLLRLKHYDASCSCERVIQEWIPVQVISQIARCIAILRGIMSYSTKIKSYFFIF